MKINLELIGPLVDYLPYSDKGKAQMTLNNDSTIADMLDKLKITQLEKTLFETDLIYDFHILKLNKNFIFYEIIFNGSPNIFLKLMRDRGLEFDTQNKVWIVK